MAEYCMYCGKELVEGKCDCPVFIASEVEKEEKVKLDEELRIKREAEEAAALAEAQRIEAEKREEERLRAEQEAEERREEENSSKNEYIISEESLNTSKNILISAWNLVLIFFKKPFLVMNTITEGKYRNEGLMIGGISLGIVFLTNMIHMPIPLISSYINIGYRAVIALFLILILSIIVFGLSLGVYVFRDRSRLNNEYLSITSAFSILLLPVALSNILAFLFGFFSLSFAGFALLLGNMIYNIFSVIFVFETVNGSKDVKLWKTVIIYLCIMIAVAIMIGILSAIISASITRLMGGIYSGIGGYGSFWG